jgi:hypothetical protein
LALTKPIVASVPAFLRMMAGPPAPGCMVWYLLRVTIQRARSQHRR